MPSTWLENNKAHLHIVNVEDKNYLVYLKTVGSLTPKIVEEVKTGNRITHEDIRDEIQDMDIDDIIKLMISRLN